MRLIAMAYLAMVLCLSPCLSKAGIGKAVKQVSRGVKMPQKIAMAMAAGLIFFAGTLPLPEGVGDRQGVVVFAAEDGKEEDVWRKLRANPPAHQRAVFYLVVDLFEHWRVSHLGYVGDDHDGKPLFVGMRNHVLFGGDPIFNFAVTSLIGHQGLIQENIDIEEVDYFPSSATVPYFDITLLKIHGLDMSNYEPLTLANSVAQESALQMLSYRVDLADDILHFFAYPLRYRPCRAGEVVMYAEHPVLLHTCSIPHSPAVAGSPLFSDDGDTPSLVALYISSHNKDGFDYAVPLPRELTQLLSGKLAVSGANKAATSWGALKQPY